MQELITILSNCRLKGIHIAIDDSGNNIKINGNIKALSDLEKETLKKHKDDIISFLKKAGNGTYTPITPLKEQAYYPLSSAQKRLWVLSQFEQGNAAYNIPVITVFEGELDKDALTRSFNRLIARHEILRTVFNEDEQGEIKQYIRPADNLSFTLFCTDLQQEGEKEEKVRAAVQALIAAPFDLAEGPLLSAGLFQVAGNKWIFAFSMHHIITDGWSMGILINELLLLYNSDVRGEGDPLIPLRIQYKDYAAWQQQQLSGAVLNADKAYWLKQLEGPLPVLELAGDKVRPAIKTYNGGSVNSVMNAGISKGLKLLSLEEGGTLFMGLLAAVNALLYRYTNQEDIIIGSPIAGREQVELEDQVGFYVNTLALRTRFKGEYSYRELFAQVKEVIYEAHEHQAYPFDELVDALQLQHNMDRNALFDIVVTLQNTATEYTAAQKDLHKLKTSRFNEAENAFSKFDLTFSFVEREEEIAVTIDYNTDIYHKDTIIRLAGHLTQLLDNIVAAPGTPVNRLEYVSATEKHQLLATFNNTAADYPGDKTIIALFEEQVEKTPDNIALIFEATTLTYQELNEISNRLAGYLKAHYAVQADELIGIQLGRSEWMIIAILAVLKAGGAYVPIDGEYPEERIRYMLADSSCKTLIDEAVLEHFQQEERNYPSDNPAAAGTPASLAYVMYTSGSVGMPKGVMIEHRSVVRLVKSTNFVSLTGKEVLLSTGALSFDATTFEYWGMLLNGGRLIICTKEVLLDGKQLAAIIRKEEVDIMWFTAGWLNELVDKDIAIFTGLKTIVAGGDKLSPVHINGLKRHHPDVKIVNGYGPTENTTFSLTYPVTSMLESIPVGKPINNSTAYIMDERHQLCPIGVIGEIVVGGAGLARGYLKQPALTAEKFVQHPFRDGERLYKTGDFGRWLPDGNIAFLGRKDAQLKIRGYRIEPGEIEGAIQDYPAVDAAVVQARAGKDMEKELIAYIVGKETINTSALRGHLRKLLPAYMVPAFFIQLESLPLTANGKVDRKSLPDPDGLDMETGVAYVAPRNEMETILAGIWQEILGRPQIGVKDNFFELGGHSIKATRLVSHIHKAFDVKVTLKELFTHTVLEAQAQLISQAGKTAFINITPAPKQEYYPLSSAQKRIFFLQEFAPESTGYNMPMVNYLGKTVNKEQITSVFQQLVTRHDSFRTSFEKVDGIAIQRIHENILFKLDEQVCLPEDFDACLSAYITPFDLSKAPLLRVLIVEVTGTGYALVVDTHHIISDGTSHQVLIDDFMQLYRGEEIPDLRLQYKDFSEWQNRVLESGELEDQKQYWLSQFSGGIPRLNFPASRARPVTFNFEGANYGFTISAPLTARIKEFGRRYQGTLQMTLLSVLNTLLYKYTGQDDFIIGTGIAGRRHPDVERIVGMFVNSLAIRSFPKGDSSFTELYQEVAATCIAAYENQDIQFEDLVDMLKVQRDPSSNPVFDIALVVQNFTHSEADKSVLLEGTPEVSTAMIKRWKGSNTAKFDMTWFVTEQHDEIVMNLEYYSAIYDHENIERLAGHFMKVLETVLATPDILLADISILTEEEESRLLLDYVHGRAQQYPAQTLQALFEERRLLSPASIAVKDKEGTYTYEELGRRADQLSRFLLEGLGLTTESRVGILQSRNKETIVSILGVLKAGGAYVPLDSDYPQERLLYMLEDAGVNILLTEKDLIEFSNRLIWKSRGLKHLVCVDSENIYEERGLLRNDLMRKDLWDHVGDIATDAISGGGWKSSYTGGDLSREEMDEYSWNVYLKLKGHLHADMKVLEIGCSSGLTMFRIAPQVKAYYGTDLSSTIINNTRQVVEEKGLGNITLSCIPAHEIDQLDEDEFDLIIINSVIQCFDGHNYFRDIMVKAVRKLKETGLIFLGDIMDEDKREELVADLEMFKQANQGKGYKTNTDLSTKLFLSRAYFSDLVQDSIGIVDADFTEKIHTISNELTRYRYDALLKIDKHASVRESPRVKYLYDRQQVEKYEASAPATVTGSNSMAYVIYTSGSTGKPKGVMVEHRTVVNLITSQTREFGITDQENILQLSNVTFDASVEQIFLALTNGACLHMIDKETILEPEELALFIRDHKITHVHAVPNILRTLKVRKYPHLRRVVSGGDRCAKELADSWSKYHTFYNKYGPTETTVTCIELLYDKNNPQHAAMPIGRPIDNTVVYILDDRKRLAPVGVAGEICIGGAGVTRGYLNLPELTAERFVPDPFQQGERIYRTGDSARWMTDGNIEFIGRLDDQVKIRGHRIELGEIETAIQNYPDIDKAIVVARTGKDNEKELVAYTISKETLNASDLQAFLSRILPVYMLPAHFVSINNLPLNHHGKIDRKRLPDPAGSALSIGETYVAPRNETERKLILIWQEVLGSEGIGVKDNFFVIGGHSLRATRLSSQIHKVFDVKIPLKELFTYPILEEQAQLIAKAAKTSFITIPRTATQDGYLLSSSQRRLWVLSQFEEGNIAYNMPRVYILEGKLDRAALTYAFDALLERHESLRTIFKEDEEGEIKQFICPAATIGFEIAYQDVRQEKEQAAVVEHLVQSTTGRPFDLATGPLLHAALYQVADHKWVFTYVMHHIICDGWSMDLLIRELLQLYNARLNGEEHPLTPLRIQYKDYAAWQQEQLSAAALQEHKAYWLKQFEGTLPILQLSGDSARPAVKTYNGGMVSKHISAKVSKALSALCQEQGATLFMSLLAAVKALLYRYTQQDDIIIGTPIAAREHADLEDQIGFYVNMLALRTQFSGTDNFRELLENVKEVTLDAYKHQAYPFDELVDQLRLERNMSRSALFDVMVALQNNEMTSVDEAAALDELKVKPYEAQVVQTSKFDLTFTFFETGPAITVSVQYNSDLFSEGTIERLSGHLLQLLETLTEQPSTPIQQLDYLSAAEKHKLVADFNGSRVTCPGDRTVVDLFEEQVKRTPDNIALVFEGTEISYKQLNEWANQLAGYLRDQYTIQPDDLIAIKLIRNEWLVIAILGVLKSGAAYVPIDPEYPQERVDLMIADSRSKILIDEPALVKFKEEQQQYDANDPGKISSASNLAYVIYTSGSSGTPKGVLVTHGNLHHFLAHVKSHYTGTSPIIQPFIASGSFDISVFQLFTPLLSGGTSVLVDKAQLQDMDQFVAMLKNVTFIDTVPGVYNLITGYIIEHNLSEAFQHIERIFIGGDAIPDILLYRLSKIFSAATITVTYGPTEGTVFCTHLNYEPGAIRSGTKGAIIGRPINNSAIYITDDQQKLMPVGTIGEICIAGDGLAQGYLNQVALTAEKFVGHPFTKNERMYKTGDLGRWLPDGTIEFLGRKDEQVKINGFRIELGEIDTILQKHIDIDDAIVIARPTIDGEKELVAYVVSAAILNTSDLRAYLSKTLPAYMVPGHFVQLVQLPLTPNGKIDRKRLPAPESLGMRTGVAYVAPRNEIEEKLVLIWQGILEREEIGVNDNFFDLGGHSLKATRLIARVKREFKIEIDLRNIFSEPTIAALAEKIINDTWMQNSLVEDDDNSFDEIKI
jgi:amino acid adenylation domain-containing protein